MQNIYPTAYLLISYLLGSVPFGYIISNFSGKKILEIGWRKTSGSNVFKNVGKKQGIATAFLDIFKGYLAVWGAEKLGFSQDIQIFSGVAAVVGHNWSCFLNFSGGRGIGTFGGALLAMSPKIMGIAVVSLVSVAVIWDAAIGTIFILALIIFSYIFSMPFFERGQAEMACIFTTFCLIPIFIKRLSPIKEIFTAKNKAKLILSRLIFDDNAPNFDFRIKRIAKKLTKS